MSSFKDTMGREWQLNINVAAMRRARAYDIDLSLAVQQLNKFFMDDVFFVDAIWAIVKPLADEKGITQEQFESAFDGAITEQAREALWVALGAYYDTGRSEFLKKAVEVMKAGAVKAAADLTKATAELISIG